MNPHTDAMIGIMRRLELAGWEAVSGPSAICPTPGEQRIEIVFKRNCTKEDLGVPPPPCPHNAKEAVWDGLVCATCGVSLANAPCNHDYHPAGTRCLGCGEEVRG